MLLADAHVGPGLMARTKALPCHHSQNGCWAKRRWGTLQRACDYMAQVSPARCVRCGDGHGPVTTYALGVCIKARDQYRSHDNTGRVPGHESLQNVRFACSITIVSSSKKYAKLICSTGSPQAALVKRGELCHISEVPTALQVATSGTPSIVKVGWWACTWVLGVAIWKLAYIVEYNTPWRPAFEGGWPLRLRAHDTQPTCLLQMQPNGAKASFSRKLATDYMLLYEAGCTCFATIPLWVPG